MSDNRTELSPEVLVAVLDQCIADHMAHGLSYRAEIARLRTALAEIVAYEPTLNYTPVPNEGCEDCDVCTRREWPPSGLCNTHYPMLARQKRDNERTLAAQHHYLREIAHRALATPQQTIRVEVR